MRGRQPFRVAADHAATGARLVDGGLQVERVPLGDGLGDRLRVRLATENLQLPCLQVRQAEMRQNPAPVLGRPGLRDGDHLLVVLVDYVLESAGRVRFLHVGRASEPSAGVTRIDRGLLPASGFLLPDVGDGDADAGQHRRAGLADLEARREHRIGAGQRDLVLARHALAAGCHHLFECRGHSVLLCSREPQ